jgi:hypothetical protein
MTGLLKNFNGTSWVTYTLPISQLGTFPTMTVACNPTGSAASFSSCTLSSTLAFTGSALGVAAGTSGSVFCVLSANCTVSGAWAFSTGAGTGSLTIGDITLTAVNNHELVFGSGQSIRLPANGVLEFGANQASLSSDDIDTIVMMNLAPNAKSQFVVQPNGTPPNGVWANIAVNRVSGANEEHLNFLSLDTGYQITQIVTGSGAYRNLIFRNVGADTFTLDTNNNVTFQRPAAFGAAAGTVPYSALEVFDYLTVSQLTPSAADRGYRLRTSLPQAWSLNASNSSGSLYVYDQTNGKFPLTIAPNTQIATFAGTADATSTTTGTIVDSGGLGIAKSLWVGGTANIAGLSTLGNLKSSTNAGQAVNFAGTTENAALFWNITAASASAQEIGASFFMTSSTGAASGNNPNSAWKMGLAVQSQAHVGSGNIYGMNIQVIQDSGVGNFTMSGLEIDMNNNNVDFPESGAGGAVGVGLSILTASNFPLAAAINLGTVNTSTYAFHDGIYIAPSNYVIKDFVIHDASHASYSYNDDGVHSASGIWEHSTSPIGIYTNGTFSSAAITDNSTTPYGLVLNGTYSAHAIHTPGLAEIDSGVLVTAITVASLPSCVTGLKGVIRTISDGNAPTFGSTAAGGGAVVRPVFCNGSNWIY